VHPSPPRPRLRLAAVAIVVGLAVAVTAGCGWTQTRQAADTARSAANEDALTTAIRRVAPTTDTTVLVFGDPSPLYRLGRTPFTPLMSAACSLWTDGIRRVVLGSDVSVQTALDELLDADPDVIVLSGDRLCLPPESEDVLRARLEASYTRDAAMGPSEVWTRTRATPTG
jgi:hypothetical protein